MSLVPVSPPDWPGNVRLFYSTRTGGASLAPYDSFNLGLHVGDSTTSVMENRRRLQACLPPDTRIAWLEQVHGSHVVAADDALDRPRRADGSWTGKTGVACAVMSADCLPVMLTDRSGTVVAGVHAGWRGLAAGVLEATAAALPVPSGSLLAWLGPAIGADAFEVGDDVRERFLAGTGNGGDRGAGAGSRVGISRSRVESCFRSATPGSGRWLADLRGLAMLRLDSLGIASIAGDAACTFSDDARFYSHRRDGDTGRMVSLILRQSTV